MDWGKNLKRADVAITEDMRRAREVVLPMFAVATVEQHDDAHRCMRALEPAQPVVVTDEMVKRASAFLGRESIAGFSDSWVRRLIETAITPSPPLVVYINNVRHEFPGHMRHDLLGMFQHMVEKLPKVFSFSGPQSGDGASV